MAGAPGRNAILGERRDHDPLLPRRNLRGFLKITRDLTERMRSEEGLRHAQAELEMRVNERTAERARRSQSRAQDRDRRTASSGAGARKRVAVMAEDDRRKNEFLATLAHELRNPLAPIQYAYELLSLAGNNEKTSRARGAVDPPPPGAAHGPADRRSARSVAHHPEQTRAPPGPGRPGRDHRGCRRDGAAGPGGARARFPSAGRARPRFVHADRTRLAQVFSNLLGNAAKFTERGGRIRLNVGAERRATSWST